MVRSQQLLHSLSTAQLPFAQPASQPAPAPAPAPTTTSCHSPHSSLKACMNSQLLCTQALLESNEFKLLAYDNIDYIKNTISKLENQLSSLNSKLKLELKILQASNLLRPDLVNLHDDLDRFPERFKHLYDQKESVQSQLEHLRTLLFQHLSAALALGYKKLEHLLNNPSTHPQLSSTPFSLVGSPSPPSTRSNRSTTFTRFDGPHMFASDQTASSVFSLPNHRNSPEPFRHPSPSPRSKLTKEDHQNNLLKQEIASLKALLKAKDSIIAEQSSDLNLLELELETLKQSLADQSSNHLQPTRDQSSSQRDSEIHIESLQSQNSKLTRDLKSSKDQIDSSTSQINQLKLQINQLNSELTSERSTHGNRQKSNDDRLKEAEHRATLIENSHSQLQLTVSNLKAECEAAQESSRTAQIQVKELETDLKSSRDQHAKLDSEIDYLKTQSLSKDQALITLEAENKADWEFFIDRLLILSPKLNDDPTNPSKLTKFLSQLSSSRLELLKNRKQFSQGLLDGLVDYVTKINAQLALIKIENDSSSTASTNLADELEKLRQSNNQERSELMVRLNELESQNEELRKQQQQQEAQQSEQEVSKNDTTDVESLKLELAMVKQQLAEKEAWVTTDRSLRELWKLLPINLDSRGTMNLDSDLSQLKTLYESPKKATGGGGGGLGGLFGLGRRAATPTPTPSDDTTVEFSVELLLEKIRLLIENDRKLIDRLVKYEAEKDSHKANSIRAQKLVAESQDALRTYQSQVKELEERLEYANTQSAAMLEKVNDLMESEERSNMMARRAELNVQKLQIEIESLKHGSTT